MIYVQQSLVVQHQAFFMIWKEGANEMTQNEEKTTKSQKIQDRIIMAMIWIVAALVIALVLGTVLNYINIFK